MSNQAKQEAHVGANAVALGSVNRGFVNCNVAMMTFGDGRVVELNANIGKMEFNANGVIIDGVEYQGQRPVVLGGKIDFVSFA